MRNNANKSIIPYITLYACTSNHDNQFHIVNCLNNLYDILLDFYTHFIISQSDQVV